MPRQGIAVSGYWQLSKADAPDTGTMDEPVEKESLAIGASTIALHMKQELV